jgi:hypothetical protein
MKIMYAKFIDPTPKECPKCGCIELFSKGKKVRKAIKSYRPITLFYENFKHWSCLNTKCGHSWDQVITRYDPGNSTENEINNLIEKGISYIE